MSERLHLSLLTLDPLAGRAARDCLADIQQMHRLVMRGFPDTDARDARRKFNVLFRVDAVDRLTQILVQSTTEPDWAELETGLLTAPARVRDASPLHGLPVGASLRFLLVANPTRAIRPDGRESRHAMRVPMRADEGPNGRIDWLTRKAEQSGFRLDRDSLLITGIPLRRGARGKSRVVIEQCRFDGLLEVTEPDRFRAAITQGIGRARAYGCGLLSVRRP